MPAYNEEARVTAVVDQLAVALGPLGDEAEIIVIDDGSSDRTADMVPADRANLIRHEINRGKAAAVQTGIAASSGRFVAVLDADLEYYPSDLLALLARGDGSEPIAVYGSRYREPKNFRGGLVGFLRVLQGQEITSWLANWTLSVLVLLLFQRWITDTLTGLKLYPGEFLRSTKLTTTGFEGDHEITARLVRARIDIEEVPIAYAPRARSEGKKIGPLDGVKAIMTFARFRFAR